MSIDQIIRERRTVHCYLPEEVPLDTIIQALELATFAPSHKLTFPFLFIPVGPQSRVKIAEIAYELKGQRDLIRKKFLEEGSLVFFAQKLCGDEFMQKEDYATLACSIQNFSLSLWEKGYGTKWSSGGIIRSEETYKVLGLNQDEYEIVAMVWVGKYNVAPKVPPRPKLTSFIKSVD